MFKTCSISTPETITLREDENGKDTYEYVPLTPQLKKLVPDKTSLLSVLTDSTSEQEGDYDQPRELRGIWDGSMHQPMDNDTLHLSIYYDDFQVGNPLSSKAKYSKVGAVYCAVNNMKGGTEVNNILLVMIFL